MLNAENLENCKILQLMHEHNVLNHPPVFLIGVFPVLFCYYKYCFDLCLIVLLGPESRPPEEKSLGYAS